jgi:flagellar basal-body rod modification protein FlgD
MTTASQITNSSIVTSAANSSSKTSAATDTQSTGSSSSTSKSTDIMGKQDFLKLLITQLQNQDPLNPDNPTEFTAQLAQFSSLEQMYNLNDSMNSLVTSTNNSTKLSALGMMGKEVVYQGSSFSYDGNPMQLGYTLDGPASEVQLAIQNSSGTTVQVLNGTDLTKGNHMLNWDGLDQEGNALPSGTYNIVIKAKGVDSEGVAASPLIRSEVTGVDLSNEGSALLNTKAGDIDFSKILGAYPVEASSNTVQNTDTAATDTSAVASATADTGTNTTDTIS